MDWGDGTPVSYTTSDQGVITNTRINSGSEITVIIRGDVVAYGDYESQKPSAFRTASNENVKSVEVIGMDTITDASYMFWNMEKATSFDLQFFWTTNIRKMAHMFNSCRALTELNFNFDRNNTHYVTTMASMFANCVSLDTLFVSRFRTENVRNMTKMFSYNRSLDTVDISEWCVRYIDSEPYEFALQAPFVERPQWGAECMGKPTPTPTKTRTTSFTITPSKSMSFSKSASASSTLLEKLIRLAGRGMHNGLVIIGYNKNIVENDGTTPVTPSNDSDTKEEMYCVFECTGEDQEWIVPPNEAGTSVNPDGVTPLKENIKIWAWGAGGSATGYNTTEGGAGGFTYAEVPVYPGEKLIVGVGQSYKPGNRRLAGYVQEDVPVTEQLHGVDTQVPVEE